MNATKQKPKRRGVPDRATPYKPGAAVDLPPAWGALTPRQAEVMQTLLQLYLERGYMPGFRQIAERMRCRINAVCDVVAVLKRKGVITDTDPFRIAGVTIHVIIGKRKYVPGAAGNYRRRPEARLDTERPGPAGPEAPISDPWR